MVQLTGVTLLALASIAAAGAHRMPHEAFHRRGGGESYSMTPAAASETYSALTSPAPVTNTYTTSSPAAASETTCTDEESTTPQGSTSTYMAPSSYPKSSPPAASSYPASSPAASSYPASSPAASSYPASSPSAASSYPASSPPAASSYPASNQTYPASAPTYPASSPVAESSYPASYPASSPVAASSYPASSPQGKSTGKSTSTSTYYMTSTALYTVTGSAPTSPAAGSGYPAAGSGSPAAGSSAPQGGCGTVTVTVTASPAGSPAPHQQKSKHSQPAAGSSYQASSPQGSTYAASTPAAAQTYHTSAPASSYPTKPTAAPVAGKRGVAFASVSSLNFGSNSNIAWAWNWSPSASGLPENVEFVPALKDISQVGAFQQAAESASYVMAFNEVDMTVGGGGTAMSPSEAAANYKEYIMPYAGKCSLGAPSVTSDNSPNSNLNGVSPASGTDYLQQFAQACTGCQIDFACAHWYGQAGASGEDQAQLFITYIEQYISTVKGLWGEGTKVWVTEFSALPEINQDTQGINAAFMEKALPYLDSNPDIERYSYYAAIPEMLVNSDGTLTSIGQTYASA